MKNSIMQTKAISILVIAAITFSLTGCSGTKQVEDKPDAEVSVEAQAVSKNSDSNSTSQKSTAESNNATPVDNSTKETVAIEEIKFIDGPLPLDLKPHDPMPDSYFKFFREFPVVGPYYGDGWRMQVVKFRGNTAVIDFGNTSSKPLVISNDNVCYVLFGDGTDNISGSYIVGGPVTIAPNEIKRVTIKAKRQEAVSLYININGFDKFMDDILKSQSITDAKPFVAAMDDYLRRMTPNSADVLRVRNLETVSGNGKFKYVAESITLIANDHIGPFTKSTQPQGSLALVKIKIANTSNEVMTISKIRQNYFHTGSRSSKDIPIGDDTLKALGASALPTTIQPGEIVEGYMPVSFMGNEYLHGLVFDSNMGPFVIADIETFPLVR